MKHDTIVYKGSNGEDIFTYCWKARSNPLGILQIFHGMAEHAERYGDLACYLNTAGITVYACDQKGHGRTGELGNSSDHIANDGFNGIVKDQKLLFNIIRNAHPGLPVFVMGHSFGSFIAQDYIRHYGRELSGAILSGSSRMQGISLKFGLCIAAVSLIFGRKRPNSVLDALSFGNFNKSIENPCCKFAWLSRDEVQVRKYEKDKLCGNVMSTNFFYYFFKGLSKLYSSKAAGNIPKELPIYIISGSRDPVSGFGKGTAKLFEWYRNLGIEKLEMKLYEESRHEIINEINREEVYNDILSWLGKHI